jgi:hypothetical protein
VKAFLLSPFHTFLPTPDFPDQGSCRCAFQATTLNPPDGGVLKEDKMTNVFVLLDEKTRAIDVLGEISKPSPSDNPVARAIVDGNFGNAAILTQRPQDLFEQRVLRLEASRPHDVISALVNTPGVSRAATSYTSLAL